MRALQLIGSGMVLLFVGAAAQAQVTGTVSATSDYDFRGISQTMEDPALQASLDWVGKNGWYAGLWGSNVDFDSDSNVEVDGYFGYSREWDSGFGWDVGLTYYSYWPRGDDINYAEVYAGFTYKIAEVKVWYTNDYVNSGDPSLYIEGNLKFELPQDFGLKLHGGHYSGDGIEGEVGDSYNDYSAGITRTFGHFDLELKYVDTNIDIPDVGDGRVVFTVATTFPWGK